jgi:hypothetical protein
VPQRTDFSGDALTFPSAAAQPLSATLTTRRDSGARLARNTLPWPGFIIFTGNQLRKRMSVVPAPAHYLLRMGLNYGSGRRGRGTRPDPAWSQGSVAGGRRRVKCSLPFLRAVVHRNKAGSRGEEEHRSDGGSAAPFFLCSFFVLGPHLCQPPSSGCQAAHPFRFVSSHFIRHTPQDRCRCAAEMKRASHGRTWGSTNSSAWVLLNLRAASE